MKIKSKRKNIWKNRQIISWLKMNFFWWSSIYRGKHPAERRLLHRVIVGFFIGEIKCHASNGSSTITYIRSDLFWNSVKIKLSFVLYLYYRRAAPLIRIASHASPASLACLNAIQLFHNSWLYDADQKPWL